MIIMPFASFDSTNIAAISDVVDNQVNITFKSTGKEYTYQVTDSEAFVNDLTDVISEGESVGRFINRARATGILQEVNPA
jgi:hypothetical protein